MNLTDLLYGKYRNLILATAMFNLGFVIWFSFAPFTGRIADEFGLSVAQLGIVASAAIVAVPLGRIIVGPSGTSQAFATRFRCSGWPNSR